MDGTQVEALLADHAHTQSYYAERYACAYLVQQTSGSWPLTVWYLDDQSVRERTRMCAFLGVDRVCLSDTDAASSLFWKGLSRKEKRRTERPVFFYGWITGTSAYRP